MLIVDVRLVHQLVTPDIYRLWCRAPRDLWQWSLQCWSSNVHMVAGANFESCQNLTVVVWRLWKCWTVALVLRSSGKSWNLLSML